MSLEAKIWALRLEFGPSGWKMSPATRIWASEPKGGTEEKEKEEEEKLGSRIRQRLSAN